jgi:hypothetical protein
VTKALDPFRIKIELVDNAAKDRLPALLSDDRTRDQLVMNRAIFNTIWFSYTPAQNITAALAAQKAGLDIIAILGYEIEYSVTVFYRDEPVRERYVLGTTSPRASGGQSSSWPRQS